MKKSILKTIFLFFLSILVFQMQVDAGETLDYSTEHLLEAAMNARFQNFPDIETGSDDDNFRAKLGYSRFTVGPHTSDVILTSIQKTFVQNSSSQTIWSLFYDHTFTKTKSELITAHIIKNEPAVISQTASVLLDADNSYAQHFGIGIGKVYRFSNFFIMEAGLSGEVYKITNLNLKFTTINEVTNYSGTIDYDHTYLIYTPHVTLNWLHAFKPWGMNSATRIIITYPMPRKDLPRVVHVGNNQKDLETGGKHIPDGFLGIGYSLESPTKKWRIDLGSTLDFFALEGMRHKGVSNPFLLSGSFIFN